MIPIDSAALEGLTEIFRVLGDPTRLRILDALSRDELCVGDLATQLGVTESAVSHQLRLLRTARLVRARRDGRMIFYSLHDTHVLTLFDQALRHVQEPGHAGRVEHAAPASGPSGAPSVHRNVEMLATPPEGERVSPNRPIDVGIHAKSNRRGGLASPKPPSAVEVEVKSGSGGGN